MAPPGSMPNLARNTLAVLAVGVFFVGLEFLGPDWYKLEAEFKCPPDYKLETTYPDMVQCSKAMDAASGSGCGCSRPENPWARVYADYVVPPLVGIVAWLLLVGSIGARIGLLNAGYWGAIFLLGIYYAFANTEGIEALILSFAYLIYVALIASVVLVVLHYLSRGIARIRAGT